MFSIIELQKLKEQKDVTKINISEEPDEHKYEKGQECFLKKKVPNQKKQPAFNSTYFINHTNHILLVKNEQVKN